MLTKQQEEAITKLMSGEQRTAIAKDLHVSRTALYDWLGNKEFQAELESRRKEIVKSGNSFILARTENYLEQLNDIALHSEDQRSKLSALTYLLDKALGKTATTLTVEPIEKNSTPSRDELEQEFINCRYNIMDDNITDSTENNDSNM